MRALPRGRLGVALRYISVVTFGVTLFACGVARADASGTRVLTVVLPNRRGARDALEERTRTLSTTLTQRWSATPKEAQAAELGPRFERAQTLAASARFDDAATAFDAVLEDAARQVDRAIDPSVLTAAVIKRSAIALARNENERAEELLQRLRHYDPGFTLAPREASPALRAAFEHAIAKGAAPIRASDLGEACQASVEIVLVARAAAPELGPDAIEMSRFDRLPNEDGCRLVSSAVAATPRDDDALVRALTEPIPTPPPVAVVETAPLHARTRTVERAIGISALILGAALASAGAYFLVDAHAKSNVNAGCSAATPCTGALLRTRTDAFDSARTNGAITLSIGGVALVGGAVATYFGFRF